MDKPKPNKLNAVIAERFYEISQGIKESIASLTQPTNRFEFSQPVEVSAPISNSNPLGITNFTFSEPSKELTVEDNASVEELVEKISSLAVHGTEYETVIKMEFPSYEAESNDGNEYIQTASEFGLDNYEDECTVPWNGSIKSSVSNGGQSSLQMDYFRQPDVTFELYSNDDVYTFSVPLNASIEHGADTDESANDIDNNEAYIVDNGSTFAQDVVNTLASNNSSENIQTSAVKLNSYGEGDVGSQAFADDVNENIPATNIHIAQDVDNVTPHDTSHNSSTDNLCRSGDIDPNPHIDLECDSHSVKLKCCVKPDVAKHALLKDVNENIPSPEKSQDVDIPTPSVNSPADTRRSGDIDPNTQITHMEVDSHRPPQRLYANQPLPFLIKHVHRITWPNQKETGFTPVMELFGQKFDAVMIYGVVTSLIVEQNGLKQRFVIDDGTGTINVVWTASKRILELLKTVYKLDEEVKLCRKSGLSVMNENWQPDSSECKNMLDSFETILQYIKRRITERTKLKLFGYAGVVGKPYRLTGQTGLQLYATLIEDNSRDRSLELYFKKNLIRLYGEKYILEG